MSWRKVPAAAEYYGVSVRTLRDLLKTGFPHSRLDSGTILIELSTGDKWLRSKSTLNQDKQLINSIMEDLK